MVPGIPELNPTCITDVILEMPVEPVYNLGFHRAPPHRTILNFRIVDPWPGSPAVARIISPETSLAVGRPAATEIPVPGSKA